MQRCDAGFRLTLAFAALCFLLGSAPLVQGADPPNLVVFVADDLGGADVGWRGSKIKTPHLDDLARGGTTLEQFYVQPVCSPTRAAFLTGRYPIRYGFQVGVVRPWADYGLPLEERLLSNLLADAGYYTAIVGKWHLGHFQRAYLPTARGFHHQYGHYNGALDYFTHIRDGGFDWHRDDKVDRTPGYTTKLIGEEAAQVVRQHGGKKPLFLYVPFNAVHTPYQASPEHIHLYPELKGTRQVYASMTSAMDDAIGRVVAAIDEVGIRNNTLILFFSDNGGPQPGLVTDNGPLRAGKGTVYEGGVRVVALANWPGKLKARYALGEPIHVVDLFPTLLHLANVPLENPKLPIDGRNVWTTLAEGKPSPRTEILLNASPAEGAIRVGDWKLVVYSAGSKARGSAYGIGRRPPRTSPKYELFNLREDLGEKHDLSERRPEKVRDLLARYTEYQKAAVPSKYQEQPADYRAPAIWGEP